MHRKSVFLSGYVDDVKMVGIWKKKKLMSKVDQEVPTRIQGLVCLG